MKMFVPSYAFFTAFLSFIFACVSETLAQLVQLRCNDSANERLAIQEEEKRNPTPGTMQPTNSVQLGFNNKRSDDAQSCSPQIDTPRAQRRNSKSGFKIIRPLNDPKSPQAHSKSFLHIHNRIYVALLDGEQTEIVSRHVLTTNYLVVPLEMTDVDRIAVKACQGDLFGAHPFHPAFLGDILKFNETVSSLERRKPGMKLVFQAGRDENVQVQMAFLLGCHMIMRHGVGFEETHLAFQSLQVLVNESESGACGDLGICIKSCWRAICYAKCQNWIDLFTAVNTSDGEDKRCIQIDEYIHYAE
jgi:hypothetical protein